MDGKDRKNVGERKKLSEMVRREEEKKGERAE